MGRKKISPESKRKMVGLSMHQQDIDLLNWICRDTNTTKSEAVRQLLQLASRMQEIRAAVATGKLDHYIEQIREKYITSHNVPYVNWRKKINLKKPSQKYREGPKEELPNCNPEYDYSIEETIELARALFHDEEAN